MAAKHLPVRDDGEERAFFSAEARVPAGSHWLSHVRAMSRRGEPDATA
ncbi:hypothetical protein AB0L59_10330 [Streptomyces sp. NPDC052109]